MRPPKEKQKEHAGSEREEEGGQPLHGSFKPKEPGL
jgi:hypothetical protein